MDGLGICLLILIVVSFVLFLIRIVFIFYHNIVLARELKRITREVNARQCNAVTAIELSNQTGNQPPKDDHPPAYDDVMQNFVNAKIALQAAEEGQVTTATIMPHQETNLTNAHSTITIETFIDANAGSSNDLSNTTTETIATNTAEMNDTNLDSSALPPAYERCISHNGIGANENGKNNPS